MADFLYNTGSSELWDGTIDLLTDTPAGMLVTSSYVEDRDNDVVDAGGADDAVDHELTGTGYAAGWGGAGRKDYASKAIAVDKANDRSTFDIADLVWTSINAGSAAGLLTIVEGGANDTTSRLIAFHDCVAVTNGGDLTVTIPTPANGALFNLATA
jgi:hypothetical protein